MDLGPKKIGGIVLCGGRSSRMGLAKLALPFGPELMVQRVVRLLGQVVRPIVVVAAPQQELPPLPSEVIVARDEREGRGPLEGLLAGLLAIRAHVEAAYATSCDVPLLVPAFVEELIGRLTDFDAVVPVEEQFAHPLATLYRTTVVPHIEALLAEDRLRPAFLFDRVKTCRVPVEELKLADPQLTTLRNLNRPEDYREALEQAGFALDPQIAEKLTQKQ